MSLVQRYIGENSMARHWLKIFLPNGPGRGPRLRPEASPRPEAQALAGSPALVRDLVLAWETPS